MPRLAQSQNSRHGLVAGLLSAVVILVTGSSAFAQAPVPAPSNDEQLYRVVAPKSELKMVEKFARIFQLDQRITTVYGFDAGVINVTKVEGNPSQIRVHALKPGITQMVLVDESNRSFNVTVLVTGDVRHLQALIDRLFPDANIEVVEVQDEGSVALRGWVTQPEHITYIVDVARQFYATVLNHLQVGGVQQVMLRVKVMEVQRSKIRKLGLNLLYLNQDSYLASTPGLITPIGSLATPFGGPPNVSVDVTQISNPTLSFGMVGNSNIFQGFIEALKQEGLLKIEAEPVLVTTNGRPARLTNGGEFPILVPAGLGVVGIEWREFGVELDAVPIILGNGRLRLEISPLVSERDFTNSVNVQGLTVPGLTKRGVNTQVEMRFGETLMIGGLIAHRHTAETSKVPILGELPVIGAAFSRKRYDEVETELVILVTPEYVAANKAGQVPCGGPGKFTDVPTDRELFNGFIEVPKYGDACEGHCQPGHCPTGGCRQGANYGPAYGAPVHGPIGHGGRPGHGGYVPPGPGPMPSLPASGPGAVAPPAPMATPSPAPIQTAPAAPATMPLLPDSDQSLSEPFDPSGLPDFSTDPGFPGSSAPTGDPTSVGPAPSAPFRETGLSSLTEKTPIASQQEESFRQGQPGRNGNPTYRLVSPSLRGSNGPESAVGTVPSPPSPHATPGLIGPGFDNLPASSMGR